jgi:hypothetical protein
MDKFTPQPLYPSVLGWTRQKLWFDHHQKKGVIFFPKVSKKSLDSSQRLTQRSSLTLSKIAAEE